MARHAPRISVVLSAQTQSESELATRLEAGLPHVALHDSVDPTADITYFIGAQARREPTSTLEMAWFSQVDSDDPESELVEIAREIDQPVTGSIQNRDRLRRAGARAALAIPLGIDRARFDVKLRIGIVAQNQDRQPPQGMADMPLTEWRRITADDVLAQVDEALPDLLRTLDCLVWPLADDTIHPAVLAALAVGTPVVAPDTGWCRTLPHLSFQQGHSADLRRVLEDIRARRNLLRASTDERSWDHCCEAHDRLFLALLRRGTAGAYRGGAFRAVQASAPVRLMMHGAEDTAVGGPTVRVPGTARALEAFGLRAQYSVYDPRDNIPENTVHLFNVWPPDSALRALRAAKATGKTVIFSPIYLDLKEQPFWQSYLPHMPLENDTDLARQYGAIRRHLAARGRRAEIQPGYHAKVREMLALADHVIFLSNTERAALSDIGAHVEDSRASLIRNPVDTALWEGGDPALFRNTWLASGSAHQDYVICVGRIEERKNQLMLAHALRDLPFQLVLVGHVGHAAYAQKIDALAGARVLMTGRLEPGGEMLRSALAGASAFVLPSWAEGAALVALEAAAAGASMVLSDRSSEQEYFGDLAQYCDPGDPVGMRAAILSAVERGRDPAHAEKLRAHVKESFTWEGYAERTVAAYAQATRTPTLLKGVSLQHMVTPLGIAVDLTALAQRGGQSAFNARQDARIVEALQKACPDLQRIFWNTRSRGFIEVPRYLVGLDEMLGYCRLSESAAQVKAADLSQGHTVLAPVHLTGPHPEGYLQALADLTMRAPFALLAILCDLAPLQQAFRQAPDIAGIARRAFDHLLHLVDGFVVTSQTCADNLSRHVGTLGLTQEMISVLNPGDPEPCLWEAQPDSPVQKRSGAKRFVLVQDNPDDFGNHDLLLRIWARFGENDRHRDLHLIVAGVSPDCGKRLADRIARDPRIRMRIHVLESITEADLAWLQHNCLFTVYPSFRQGWALPVTESLVAGKVCIASTCGALPERVGDHVVRIDPEDFTTWLAWISLLASSDTARQAREIAIKAEFRLVPWAQAGAELAEVARRPRRVRLARRLLVGELAGAGGDPLAINFGAAWHPAEYWGRWAAAEAAPFGLCVDACVESGIERLMIRLDLRIELPDTETSRFWITCNEQILFKTETTAQGFPNTVVVCVPGDALNAEGLLVLILHSGLAPSGRIGLASAVVLDPDLSNPLHYMPNPRVWSEGTFPGRFDMAIDAHRKVVAPGMAFSEAWGVGAANSVCILHIPLLPGAPAQTLSMAVRPVATPVLPVSGAIFWNGRLLMEGHWDSDMPETLTLHLTREDLAFSGPGVLRVQCDSRLTPADLAIGSVSDIAGLGILDLEIAPAEDAT